MSIRDLEEHGVLLPEDEWGARSLETSVPQGRLLGAFAVAVVSLVAAYVGDGGRLTWVGLGSFLVSLFAITLICDRAIERLRRRVGEERGQMADEDAVDG